MSIVNLKRLRMGMGVSLRTDRDGETRYYCLQMVPKRTHHVARAVQDRGSAELYQDWQVHCQFGADIDDMEFRAKSSVCSRLEALDVYSETLDEKLSPEKAYYLVPAFGYSALDVVFLKAFKETFPVLAEWNTFYRYLARVLEGAPDPNMPEVLAYDGALALVLAEHAFGLPDGYSSLVRAGYAPSAATIQRACDPLIQKHVELSGAGDAVYDLAADYLRTRVLVR